MNNPEIRRYAWLDFSLNRLIAMPTLFIVGITLWCIDQHRMIDAFRQASWNFQSLTGYAIVVFASLSVGWGCWSVTQALLDDVREGTWDLQRLSAMSPTALAFGTLLGSTLYSWYGALMALVVYAYSESAYHDTMATLRHVVMMLLTGVSFQCIAYFLSLKDVESLGHSRTRIQTIAIVFAAVVAAVPAFLIIASFENGNYADGYVNWYGNSYHAETFELALEFLLFCMTSLGIYARMRHQLRLPRIVFLWPLCNALVLIVSGGFHDALIKITIAIVYACAIFERWDGMTYRRVLRAVAEHNWSAAAESLPSFYISGLISGIVCLIKLDSVASTFFLLAIRDIGIMHYFFLLPSRRKATASVVLWLIVLYIVIPAFPGIVPLSSALAPTFFALTTPNPNGAGSVTEICVAVEAILVIALVLRRWNARRGQP